MKDLSTNCRFYILATSLFIALNIYGFWVYMIPVGSLQTIRLVQTYALVATLYLYITLMIGAFYANFKVSFARAFLFKARRALGVSAFFFASLHATIAFYGLLGGWSGLFFLGGNYILSISIGFIVLIILTLLAATSFDYMVSLLGRKWKMLHRFVYLAGLLSVVHALLLGSHFSDLSRLIPTIYFVLLIILLCLEGLRIDKKITEKMSSIPRFVIATILAILFISLYAYGILRTESQPFNIHEHQHSVIEVA